MRAAVAVVMATLVLGLASSQPMLAQVRAEVPALESIRMIDALTGWAVTRDQNRPSGEAANALVRTTDGGRHWRDVTPPFGLFYLNATNVAVLTARFAWVGSFRTVDAGRTWKSVQASIDIRSINFINIHDGWLLSFRGANNASVETEVYRSTDGGETWTKVASSRNGVMARSDLPDVVGGDPHITFLNAMTGWITQIDPVLYATHDGGHTWRGEKLSPPPQLTSPLGGSIKPPKFFTPRDGILPVFYSNRDPQSYRAVAPFVVIYVTHDSGTVWNYTTPVPVPQWYSISFSDMNHGWLADRNILYLTSDGGRHWTAMQPDSLTDVIQLDFVSPRVGWAVQRAFPFLLKTVDGGHTWAPVPYTISQ